ncbi:tetratricopeptide repeat protein [Jannaschia sp. 2305UL9-9]|uniref:tetratricopeptide repeat protein n=1 Tax=Jannaschia sp. 2305UL9-9 TaxID=3121638 RepID=UPI00352726A2
MRLFRWITVPVLLVALAACQSSEERAENFYRSGVDLREAGDLSRAAVEFRNVFRYDGEHREARNALAEVLLEQGKPDAAFSQYLRLAEQYPDDIEVRIALSTIATNLEAWNELRRHGPAAVDLDPDRPESRAIAALLDYMDASDASEPDTDGMDAALTQALTLLEADAENAIARRLVIIGHLTNGDLDPALAEIDNAIARAPDDLALNTLKLQVLSSLDRPAEVEALLLDLYARFPENAEIEGNLVAWYQQRGDLEAVEGLLRNRAGPRDGPVDGHIAVVQFILRTRGAEAAREEVAALIAANADNPAAIDAYTRADAAIAFDAGDRTDAVDMLRARLGTSDATAETNGLRTLLAQLLIQSDDPVGARSLVEQVLSIEPGNVAALKMQADWLIDADKTDEAIAALRMALDQAPNDSDILTTMARAHSRAGSPELAGERLALALEMSGNAPAEALRYARFLLSADRDRIARSVIRDAVVANPGNVDLLTEQGRLALMAGNTDTARAAIATLERIEGNTLATDRAKALQAALLLSEQRFDEGVALLEARADDAASSAVILDVVRTRLQAGQIGEARAYLALRLEERPEDPGLLFANAVLRIADGELGAAETDLRGLIADFPEAPAPVQRLYGLLQADNRPDEAEAVLADALERMPEATDLWLLQAARFEQVGQLEEALSIYAQLYEVDSNNLIVANNYASLLSDLREDDESLARARVVARRLSDSNVPAFQDTYGWIAYRDGDFQEALTYLTQAAEGMPDNPVVLYHLGMAYAALERPEEARAALQRAVDLGGDQPLPQLGIAREVLEGL